jgi:hypothetical protein
LAIARVFAQQQGVSTEKYKPVSAFYRGSASGGEWVVTFSLDPPVPDDCYFIMVNAQTGQASIADAFLSPVPPRVQSMISRP